jgi:2-succinyl-6-hydroxy-2,4-cyclohexadiene-1-carboxylate synthase
MAYTTIINQGLRYEIHYQIYREHLLQQESASVMLFFHGFLGDGSDFDAVIHDLPASIACITLDLPGHGQTQVYADDVTKIMEQIALTPAYTMPDVAQVLAQFMEQLGIKQIILVGYSLGGRLALYFTCQFPNYVSQLILEAASPGLQSQIQLRQEKDLALVTQLMSLSEIDLPDFIEQWYTQPLFTTLQTHSKFTALKSRRARHNPQQLAWSLRGLGVGWQPNLWHQLARLKVSILLIVGDLDQKFRDINQQMLAILPDARLVYVENCGHNAHYEQPRQFAQILLTANINQNIIQVVGDSN